MPIQMLEAGIYEDAWLIVMPSCRLDRAWRADGRYMGAMISGYAANANGAQFAVIDNVRLLINLLNALPES